MDKDIEITSILKKAHSRREMGALQYGDLNFLEKDNLIEAEYELLDLINYSLFAIIKLRKIRDKIKR